MSFRVRNFDRDAEGLYHVGDQAGMEHVSEFHKIHVATSLDENFRDYAASSDDRFVKAEQTVFGKPEHGLTYNSFQILSEDTEKTAQAKAVVKRSGVKEHTARWYQEFLSAYWGKKIELKHIRLGLTGSRYSFLVLGYKTIQ